MASPGNLAGPPPLRRGRKPRFRNFRPGARGGRGFVRTARSASGARMTRSPRLLPAAERRTPAVLGPGLESAPSLPVRRRHEQEEEAVPGHARAARLRAGARPRVSPGSRGAARGEGGGGPGPAELPDGDGAARGEAVWLQLVGGPVSRSGPTPVRAPPAAWSCAAPEPALVPAGSRPAWQVCGRGARAALPPTDPPAPSVTGPLRTTREMPLAAAGPPPSRCCACSHLLLQTLSSPRAAGRGDRVNGWMSKQPSCLFRYSLVRKSTGFLWFAALCYNLWVHIGLILATVFRGPAVG